MASRLKHNGYRIECCEHCDDSGDYLCIAEKHLITTDAAVDKLCADMQLLAEHLGVIFDGWETRIDPG
ncbi:ribonuclease E inhibitor RraB [Rhodohalobacter mucosus]|nr:ribonuclease E inhibitor RraB [Rhodohalobacter mucosus]